MPLYPPGSSTTLSDATPANVQPGVPDAGVATEASRDDHAHDASWSGVAPSASAPGDAAATGAAQGFNRRDHVHGRESYATLAANLKLDDLAAPDDNTDLNVLTTKHGLAPKLSNVATEYLSGTGVYSVPAGGSGIPATIVDAKGDIIAATAADTVARLAVGTDTHVLTADAAEATGLKWAVAPGAAGGIPATIFDAKGDLIAATAADTAARLAAGANDTVLTADSGEATGLKWAAAGGTPDPGVCEGRLTLTTGVPVTTADVTAATTLYFTPYKGSRISTYSGSAWSTSTYTEKSITLASLTAGLPYDVFIVDSTLALELLAWTNATTRATALVTQDGVLCKTGALTRRYLGTICIAATGECEDSLLKRFVFNYYNRVQRPLQVFDGTDTWTYGTATWRQARATAGNKVEFVCGVSEDLVQVRVNAAQAGGSGQAGSVGVGVDATATNSAQTFFEVSGGVAAGMPQMSLAEYRGYVAVGYHYLAWLEYARAGTVTFAGDAGVADQQSGILAEVWG